MRNIHLDDENDRAAFNFFTNAFSVFQTIRNDVSKNKIKIIPLSENAENAEEITLKRKTEKFKQMMREEGIPEENTVNVMETGNRIILFPECIIH
ncbi:hypothetical protein E2I00_014092, partial [Balaenoptera physalus]